MPNNPDSIFAFTLKYPFTADRIITECYVSVAHDPKFCNGIANFVKFQALWDTGATNSTVDIKVANKLGLQSIGKIEVNHAKGTDIANQYFVSMRLPNGLAIPSLPVLEGNLSGFDVLIGMDIIGLGDFVITNRNGLTVFTFQIPSSHSFDFSQEVEALTKAKQ